MKYIHIIKADGGYGKREAPTKPTLEEMQHIVGGYIEPVKVIHEGHIRTMVVNEEGNCMGLPANTVASNAAGRRVVGDVLVLQGYRF